MHDPVAAYLDDRRRRHASLVARLLTLQSVAERMARSSDAVLVQASSALRSLRNAAIAECASPFLWKAALELHRAGETPLLGQQLEFVVQAADSFSGVLPENAEFRVPLFKTTVFPTLQMVVETVEPGCEVVFRDRTVRVVGTGATRLLRTEPIEGHRASLLLDWHGDMFEAPYRDQLLKRCGADFVNQLSGAMALIGEAAPSFHSAMQRRVRWIVPLMSSSIDEHRSLTSPQLSDVIFVSQAKDAARMAEALVHEWSHLELNTLMDTEPIVKASPEKLFYSPWRPDARPAFGLVHALYVFCNVARFWLASAQQQTVSNFATSRLRDVYWRLRVGRLQIGDGDVTDAGEQLLNYVDCCIAATVEYGGASVPAHIQRHAHEWRSRHATLPIHLV
jgi:HEXXH motif-containing protein